MSAQDYYGSFPRNPNIKASFRNIDEAAHFKNYLTLLRDVQTRNFVLDFGNEDAWCAVDLERADLMELLGNDVCAYFV